MDGDQVSRAPVGELLDSNCVGSDGCIWESKMSGRGRCSESIAGIRGARRHDRSRYPKLPAFCYAAVLLSLFNDTAINGCSKAERAAVQRRRRRAAAAVVSRQPAHIQLDFNFSTLFTAVAVLIFCTLGVVVWVD